MVNVANALSEPGVTLPVRIYCADNGRTRTPLGEAPISHWFATLTPTASGPKATGVPSPFNTCTPIPFTVDSGDSVSVFDRFAGVTASVMTMDTCAPVEHEIQVERCPPRDCAHAGGKRSYGWGRQENSEVLGLYGAGCCVEGASGTTRINGRLGP